jgi:DNA-binding transcriptional regulator YdaS (Cro superfamily)
VKVGDEAVVGQRRADAAELAVSVDAQPMVGVLTGAAERHLCIESATGSGTPPGFLDPGLAND